MAKHTKMRLRDDTRLALWIDEPDNEGEPPALIVLQVEPDYGHQTRSMELTATEAQGFARILSDLAAVLLLQNAAGRIDNTDPPGFTYREPLT